MPLRTESAVLTRSERLYREEVKNMLILLEHYKLQLTLVLPKVCVLVRKAQQKGSKKVIDTKARSKCRRFAIRSPLCGLVYLRSCCRS